MILAIDVGNTNIVLGCMEGMEMVHVARMATDMGKTEYEYAATMKQILGIADVQGTDFDGAIISSVVPVLTGTLQSAIKMITGHRALVVGAGIKTGLNIRLDDPSETGGDLVAGAVAAVDKYPTPVIILDMGTATTIGVIDGSSSLRGGAIVPGVGVSLNALVSGTSLLHSVSIDAPKRYIGTNTIDCMKSGVVFGTACMIDGMIDRMEAELGEKAAAIVATGGLAGKIIPHCTHEIIYDSDLLLRGLAVLYYKNKK